jgi:Domain of unknown function (DUF1772)
MTRWLLTAFCLILGLETGAGFYEARVAIPLWSASVEAARGWNVGTIYVVDGAHFFVFFTPLLILSTLATLIIGWRSPQPLRKWLLTSTGIILVLIIATILYFIPTLMAVKGPAPVSFSDAVLARKIRLWVILNWIRQGLGLVAFAFALYAVGLSYRQEAKALVQPS